MMGGFDKALIDIADRMYLGERVGGEVFVGYAERVFIVSQHDREDM